jgi:hypothetical protein
MLLTVFGSRVRTSNPSRARSFAGPAHTVHLCLHPLGFSHTHLTLKIAIVLPVSACGSSKRGWIVRNARCYLLSRSICSERRYVLCELDGQVAHTPNNASGSRQQNLADTEHVGDLSAARTDDNANT